MDDNTTHESVSLLDKEGLTELMKLLTDNGHKDSLQMGANLILLGLIQYRVVDVPEEEIMEAIRIQVPLADMVIEAITKGPNGG